MNQAQVIADLRRKLAELEQLFDLRWKADMRAIAAWQAVTGKDLTWPDHADLQLWLLERLASAEAVIQVARRLGEHKIENADVLHLVLQVVAYDDKYPTSILMEADTVAAEEQIERKESP